MACLVLDGDMSLVLQMDGDAELSLQMDGEYGNYIKVVDRDAPIYTGATEVNPDFDGIVLETAQKIALSDITVNPIQVESVSNIQGGRTVYIGGII